jgi:tetratricopeptide (TPR) repeat protein
MTMKKLLYISVLLFSILSFGQNENIFEQGKELYKNGKYQQAINSWMQILENGETSAELYFNLGNAQYKLNQIGPSIYYYEKALQLAPNDADIKNNLAFAENARIDSIEPLPESVFSKWYRNIADTFTFDGWAILSVVCSIIFAGIFLLYYFSYSEKIKRLLFATSMLIAIFFVMALSMSFLTYEDYTKKQPAIIFANQLEVKTEPSMGSASAFILHEGTKVEITAQDGNWFRIALADGKDGWVPTSDLKQL